MAVQRNIFKTGEIGSPRELRSLKVEDVMTPVPITIDEDEDLCAARRLLREHKIRHLPVLHDGNLTGILSDRDTRVVALMPEIVKVAVADVMTARPVTVSEATPVLQAVSMMAAKKYGCLVVTGPAGEVAGIFTSQDALRLLVGERGLNLPAPTGYPLRECDDDIDPGDEDDCLG